MNEGSCAVSLRNASRFRPQVEQLEDRCMMSTAQLVGGLLTVTGTDQADTIVVRRQIAADQLQLDNTPSKYTLSVAIAV